VKLDGYPNIYYTVDLDNTDFAFLISKKDPNCIAFSEDEMALSKFFHIFFFFIFYFLFVEDK
jgi:hypothetical protein